MVLFTALDYLLYLQWSHFCVFGSTGKLDHQKLVPWRAQRHWQRACWPTAKLASHGDLIRIPKFGGFLLSSISWIGSMTYEIISDHNCNLVWNLNDKKFSTRPKNGNETSIIDIMKKALLSTNASFDLVQVRVRVFQVAHLSCDSRLDITNLPASHRISF